jgi:ribosomal protein S18 acetylase RimI-like enzyme
LLELKIAQSKDEIKLIKELFLEYATWLDFPLCFQGFDEELATLPGKYSLPNGRLYIAYWNNEPAGCIGLRKLNDGICEMKRLYVRPAFRGNNIGKKLVEKIIEDAKSGNYSLMRLDTIKDRMGNAVEIYENFGFIEIEAYYNNPDPNTLYMELDLTK